MWERAKEIAHIVLPALGYLLVLGALRAVLGRVAGAAAGPETSDAVCACVLLPFTVLAAKKWCPPAEAEQPPWGAYLSAAALLLALAAGIVRLRAALSGGSGAVLALLGYGIAGPVNEELVYRGFVFRRGRKVLGRWGAAALSAALFAAGHAAPGQMAVALLAGAVFACAAEFTGTLRLPVLLHICWNLLFP